MDTPALQRKVSQALRLTPVRCADPVGPDQGIATAAGPLSGRAGGSAGLSLTVIGDSTVMGVGTPSTPQGLSGALATALAEVSHGSVAWRAISSPGATLRHVAQQLVPQLATPAPDGPQPHVVVVMAGINDIVHLHRLGTFRRELGVLLDGVRAVAPRSLICVGGMPPAHCIPSLSGAAARWAGHRARLFDLEMMTSTARRDVTFLPLRMLDCGQESFAKDGFHPNAQGYRAWARVLAPSIYAALAVTQARGARRSTLARWSRA